VVYSYCHTLKRDIAGAPGADDFISDIFSAYCRRRPGAEATEGARPMTYRSKLKSESTELFFDAILSLETKEDCYRFFEDVSTIVELKSLAQRFSIANMLQEGVTYQEIERRTKASAATISRVGRCLNYGADGYKRAIEKLSKQG
jgi:TrpR-related protein YerC/YecD